MSSEKNDKLKHLVEDRTSKLLEANQDLLLQKSEIEKLVTELIHAYRDLDIQNSEKAKKAAELAIADLELVFRNKEKTKQSSELLESKKLTVISNRSLIKAERYNRSLIEVSLDPFVTIGPDGVITDVNSATEKATGINREELIGTDFSDYFTDSQRAKEGYQKVFIDGKVWDYDLVIKHIDGHTIPVLYNASVYKDETGEVIGVFAAARDITSILEAELEATYIKDNLELLVQKRTEELSNLQMLLRSSLESPRNMIILSLDKYYNYLYFNQAHKDAMKYAYGKDIEPGMNLMEQISSESDRINSKERYDLALQGTSHSTIEKWGDIAVSYYETFYNTIRNDNGEIAGCTAFARDVTERINQEEKIKELNNLLETRVLERTNQLASANKELTAFSYSVSHDLKAPLRHITGYVSLFKKKFGEAFPLEGNQYLDNVSDSAKNMGELIDGLLQYSAAGRVDMNQRTLDMFEIVNSVIQPIKTLDLSHRIQWSIGTLPAAYGDSNMIRAVWNDLIENAVKFTKNVKKPQIIIGAYERETETVYYIKDNGVGFDMNYVSKLFTVFQRLHSSEDFEGTGIGLASVRRNITRHGGKTWAEGEVGKGAAFYFSLLKRKENE